MHAYFRYMGIVELLAEVAQVVRLPSWVISDKVLVKMELCIERIK